MVAIDGEYHPKCLAVLYNRVRQHETSIRHEKSDMVAIDGEYHPKCLAALYNRVSHSMKFRYVMRKVILRLTMYRME